MKRETACMIIHGLAGSVDEIEPLYRYLTSKGVNAQTVLLHGHGGSNKELACSTYKQWICSAEDKLLSLQKEYSKVILVGFSMGGLIAVNLLKKHDVDGVVFINTPVYYWDVKRILTNLSSDFKTYFNQYFRKSTDKPLRTLIEFVLLLNKTKRLFSQVNVKVLILQAIDDDTVYHKSAGYILKKVRGEKIVKFYNKGGHQILHSCSSESVCDDVLEFIKSV